MLPLTNRKMPFSMAPSLLKQGDLAPTTQFCPNVTQNNIVNDSVLTVRRLPARLDANQVAKVLGFQPHDVPVLVQAKLLVPLGRPLPNSTKYFAALVVEQHASDPQWLDTATRIIAKHWAKKNAKENRQFQPREAA